MSDGRDKIAYVKGHLEGYVSILEVVDEVDPAGFIDAIRKDISALNALLEASVNDPSESPQ